MNNVQKNFVVQDLHNLLIVSSVYMLIVILFTDYSKPFILLCVSFCSNDDEVCFSNVTPRIGVSSFTSTYRQYKELNFFPLELVMMSMVSENR